MRTLSCYLLLATGLFLPACQGSMSGGINGVRFQSSHSRPSLPGGLGKGIEIHMEDQQGWLWVDGLPFGRVQRGDKVRVTDAPEVLINGRRRRQNSDPAQPPRRRSAQRRS